MAFEPRDAQNVRVRYSLAATFGLTRPWKFLHLRLALIEIVMKLGSLVGSPRLSLLDRHWNKTKLWVFRKSSGKSKATRCGQNKNDQYFTAAINATIQIRVCKKKSLRRRRKKQFQGLEKNSRHALRQLLKKNEFVILMMPPLTTASGSVGTSFVLDVLLVKLILSRNTIFFYFQCIKHQALDFFVALAWCMQQLDLQSLALY